MRRILCFPIIEIARGGKHLQRCEATSRRPLSWPCGLLILVMKLETSFTEFVKIPTYFLHERLSIDCQRVLSFKDDND